VSSNFSTKSSRDDPHDRPLAHPDRRRDPGKAQLQQRGPLFRRGRAEALRARAKPARRVLQALQAQVIPAPVRELPDHSPHLRRGGIVDRGGDDERLRHLRDHLLHIPRRLLPGVQGGAGDGCPPGDGGPGGERPAVREDDPDPRQGAGRRGRGIPGGGRQGPRRRSGDRGDVAPGRRVVPHRGVGPGR